MAEVPDVFDLEVEEGLYAEGVLTLFTIEFISWITSKNMSLFPVLGLTCELLVIAIIAPETGGMVKRLKLPPNY